MTGKSYIIFEHHKGEIAPVSFELVSFAARLSKDRAGSVEILLLGDAVSDMAEMVAQQTGLDVTAFQGPALSHYNCEVYHHVLNGFFEGREPMIILAGHTSRGTDLAPGIAVHLKAAHITGVIDFRDNDGVLFFGRSVYGGKRIAWVQPGTGIVVLNLMPGGSKANKIKPSRPGRVRICPVSYRPKRIDVTGQRLPQHGQEGLTEAEVIVAGGNGIGDREQIDLLYRLAGCFPRSAVAGSRIVCDRGWLPYGLQVGVTGATVSPRLYIACGISGAPQHLSGMGASEFIVAVNRDPDAAIMNTADICIVEDLAPFLPILIEAIKK